MARIKIEMHKITALYITFGIIIGFSVGVIDAVFGRVLIYITAFRNSYTFYLIPLLPISGLLIIYLYRHYGKNSQKGMGLIFEVGNFDTENIPKRLIPLIITSTWMSHLFGASVGREGVAVQIGATIGHHIGKLQSKKDAKKILLITGMAAGFSGLFQTPIAATFFAVEILKIGIIEYNALLPAITASYVASYTSHYLGLEKFSYTVNTSISLDGMVLLKFIIVAICFGIVGRIFSQTLMHLKSYLTKKIEDPFKKIFIVGIFLSLGLMLFHNGKYAGLGTNLISSSFIPGNIKSYDWILKLIFTVISISAGFQGGEVTPLFAIGSSLGAGLANLLGLPIDLIAAAGYISVFSSATNSYFASIFIAGEVFGFDSIRYILPIMTIAYLLNGNLSIYEQENIESTFNLR